MEVVWFNDRKNRQRIFLKDLSNCIAIVEPQSLVLMNIEVSDIEQIFIKQWEYDVVLISINPKGTIKLA